MAKPTELVGSLIDPVESNDLGSLNTLIGFVGNETTGAVTGPAGQTGVIHRIGSAVTEVPSVVGYTAPIVP